MDGGKQPPININTSISTRQVKHILIQFLIIILPILIITIIVVIDRGGGDNKKL